MASALVVVSCANDEYLGVIPAEKASAPMEIDFGGLRSAMTKAGTKTGQDAAALLDSNFVVEAVKYIGSDIIEVFDHYNVNYLSGTANSTASNSANWEYVGQDLNIKGAGSKLSAMSKQTIKYWDYASDKHDFIAVSLGKGVSGEYAQLSKIDYTKIGQAVSSGTPVYMLTGTIDQLASTYISDMVTVHNDASASQYGTTVTPHFHSLGTKVRIAIYETVPGYAVSDIEFYADATTTTSSKTPALFASADIFPAVSGNGKMSVYYPTNQAVVTYQTSGTTMGKILQFSGLTYSSTKEDAEICDTLIGTSNTAATYVANGAYKTVMPLSTTDSLTLRIKYTLYPTDGSKATITVDNAHAGIPAAKATWKPNYAYTYIFKISENTNGSTGNDGNGNVVNGLTAITFDGVVEETENPVEEEFNVEN